MVDVIITETKNGGDSVFNGNRILTTDTFTNEPYFCLFGGNPGAITDGRREPVEQAFDFWGNLLLYPNTPNFWVNSRTEQLLNTIPLTTEALEEIKRTVEKDLDPLREYMDLAVTVYYPALNRVAIEVQITRPESLTQTDFLFMWDAAQGELTDSGEYESKESGSGVGLDNILDFEL